MNWFQTESLLASLSAPSGISSISRSFFFTSTPSKSPPTVSSSWSAVEWSLPILSSGFTFSGSRISLCISWYEELRIRNDFSFSNKLRFVVDPEILASKVKWFWVIIYFKRPIQSSKWTKSLNMKLFIVFLEEILRRLDISYFWRSWDSSPIILFPYLSDIQN